MNNEFAGLTNRRELSLPSASETIIMLRRGMQEFVKNGKADLLHVSQKLGYGLRGENTLARAGMALMVDKDLRRNTLTGILNQKHPDQRVENIKLAEQISLRMDQVAQAQSWKEMVVELKEIAELTETDSKVVKLLLAIEPKFVQSLFKIKIPGSVKKGAAALGRRLAGAGRRIGNGVSDLGRGITNAFDNIPPFRDILDELAGLTDDIADSTGTLVGRARGCLVPVGIGGAVLTALLLASQVLPRFAVKIGEEGQAAFPENNTDQSVSLIARLAAKFPNSGAENFYSTELNYWDRAIMNGELTSKELEQKIDFYRRASAADRAASLTALHDFLISNNLSPSEIQGKLQGYGYSNDVVTTLMDLILRAYNDIGPDGIADTNNMDLYYGFPTPTPTPKFTPTPSVVPSRTPTPAYRTPVPQARHEFINDRAQTSARPQKRVRS